MSATTPAFGNRPAGYHSPADTPDRVEAAILAAVARLVVATAWLAATAPATLSSVIGD